MSEASPGSGDTDAARGRERLSRSGVLWASGALLAIASAGGVALWGLARGGGGRAPLFALPPSASAARPPTAGIPWLPWGKAAFDRARDEDRLILLDLTTVWCHWCHVMDRTTYADPDVIRIVRDRLVPIRVDGDERPDIQDRYLSGGWPTTAILLPDGMKVWGGTFLPASDFLRAVGDLLLLYRDRRDEVVRRADALRAGLARGWISSSPAAAGGGAGEALARLRRDLAAGFDPRRGGWGEGGPRFPQPGLTEALLAWARREPQGPWREMAASILGATLRLSDPVWGGFYRYAVNGDWTAPHTEKILDVQAGLLENYAHAYLLTGEARWLPPVASTLAYVRRFLTDPAGGFYASQDADVEEEEGRLVEGDRYYLLSAPERRALGLPRVDRRIFTGGNGCMIEALAEAWPALASRDDPIGMAEAAADRVWRSSWDPERGLSHALGFGPRGLLVDQVDFARGLLALSAATGNPRWVDRAWEIVAFLGRRLADPAGGGFFSNAFPGEATGALIAAEKPPAENAAAALLLADFGWRRDDAGLRREGRAASAGPLASSDPGARARAIVAALRSDEAPVEMVFVGKPESRGTARLRREILRVFEPGRLVVSLDPRRGPLDWQGTSFPRSPMPAAYVCRQDACSPPIRDAEGAREMVARFLGEKRGAP